MQEGMLKTIMARTTSRAVGYAVHSGILCKTLGSTGSCWAVRPGMAPH
jgi:hypothetical protein